MPADADRFESAAQIAREFQIPVRTVYAWRYHGRGPVAHKIGRHLRFRRADVEHWLRARRDPEAV